MEGVVMTIQPSTSYTTWGTPMGVLPTAGSSNPLDLVRSAAVSAYTPAAAKPVFFGDAAIAASVGKAPVKANFNRTVSSPGPGRFSMLNNPGDAQTTYSTQFNQAAYDKAQAAYSGQYSQQLASWMKSSGRYKDWTDAEIQAFATETASMTPEQRAATEMTENARIMQNKAVAEAQADRTKMLGELEAYKANYGEARINDAMSREKTYWDARNGQILKDATAKMANMGRIASPYVLSQISQRLTGQAAGAIQVRRFQYEQENAQMQQYYVSTLNNVLSNTVRPISSPTEIAAMATKAGSAAAAV